VSRFHRPQYNGGENDNRHDRAYGISCLTRPTACVCFRHGGKRLRQDTRGGLGDEPEETYASKLDPWLTSCLPWFSPTDRNGEPLPIDGNVYRDHGLGLKSGLIRKDRLLADRAPGQLALPGYPLARR